MTAYALKMQMFYVTSTIFVKDEDLEFFKTLPQTKEFDKMWELIENKYQFDLKDRVGVIYLKDELKRFERSLMIWDKKQDG